MKNRIVIYNLIFIILMIGFIKGENSNEPSVKEIIKKMELSGKSRFKNLKSYVSIRTYQILNRKFNFSSTCKVKMIYSAPYTKDFKIIKKAGSKVLQKLVFNKILKSEKDHAKPGLKSASDITSHNYNFNLIGSENLDQISCWVLKIIPKRKSKYLLNGKIWVSKNDYSIVKVMGTPSKMPSFWTRNIHFSRVYKKYGQFYLPKSDHSVNSILIFGDTELNIKYEQYVLPNVLNQQSSAKIMNYN